MVYPKLVYIFEKRESWEEEKLRGKMGNSKRRIVPLYLHLRDTLAGEHTLVDDAGAAQQQDVTRDQVILSRPSQARIRCKKDSKKN